MPFIANIAQLKSLAIVGTAKNVGKTESLNYILGALRERHPELQLALTSIGIDGELRNQRCETLIPCELRATYGYAPCGLDAQEP